MFLVIFDARLLIVKIVKSLFNCPLSGEMIGDQPSESLFSTSASVLSYILSVK